MRASRALTMTAAVIAVVGLATPFASASSNEPAGGPAGGPGGGGPGGGPRNVSVSPYSVHPGASMEVKAEGCTRGGTVWSPGNFEQANLSGGSPAFATVHIRHNARTGDQNLSVKCHDNSLVATQRFRILEGRGAQGGLGGSIGPSATETAIGAGLVGTAALGAGIHVMRRRRPVHGRV
ncbi:hypothetical protein OHS33_31590 [Streptomyces sp. NBC_00536]|uniref:hypothetical protein n=1 Tax=Streptomyces sp. NBC_00536 TaxID=2975769 RepID=UPI002E801463|nr:hypothetical protein [Streptomyces sp. NBC_00536]WUC82501.1 hypothetical protein OHS33_31590 [Streptomyces sp. NBC_00536]